MSRNTVNKIDARHHIVSSPYFQSTDIALLRSVALHNWSLVNTPSSKILNVVWVPAFSVFVAISFGVNKILTSVDGLTWIAPTNAATADPREIAFSDTEIIITGNAGLYKSIDGINFTYTDYYTLGAFTNQPSGFWGGSVQGITWTGTYWLVAIRYATTYIVYSTNGTTWTLGPSATSKSAVQLYTSPLDSTIFAYGTGSGYELAYSDDEGFTWYNAKNDGYDINHMLYISHLELYMGVTNNADLATTICTSITGKSDWAYISLPYTSVSVVHRLGYSPRLQLIFAMTNSGDLIKSHDGVSWANAIGYPGFSGHLTFTDIAWSPELNLFVCSAQSALDLTHQIAVNV